MKFWVIFIEYTRQNFSFTFTAFPECRLCYWHISLSPQHESSLSVSGHIMHLHILKSRDWKYVWMWHSNYTRFQMLHKFILSRHCNMNNFMNNTWALSRWLMRTSLHWFLHCSINEGQCAYAPIIIRKSGANLHICWCWSSHKIYIICFSLMAAVKTQNTSTTNAWPNTHSNT